MIPLSKPFIGEEEIEAVVEVLKSDRLALGPVNEAFEQQFAALHQANHAVSVNSGTSGLHLCIRALGLGPGDEVITSPFSFIASSNCILFEKAKPVFADVDERTFNIDPEKIEAAITPNTKAILPVHVFGEPCDMASIMEIAKKHNLRVIEDACEAVMASSNGKMVGTIGDAGVYGFYPNKQMTTGEGGIILTNDGELHQIFLSLRNQGRGDTMQWLTHVRLGYNYRISDITAAIGLEQAKKLPEILSRRSKAAQIYDQHLQGVEGIRMYEPVEKDGHSWFVYPVRVSADIRDQVIAYLNDHEIQSKAYFSPCIHLQEFYVAEFGYKRGDFPISEKLSDEIIILPFFTEITEDQIKTVCETLKTAIEKFS